MKMFPKVITSAFGITAALALNAQAQNLLVDPNFANPGLATGNYNNPVSGPNTGWGIFDSAIQATSPTYNGATYSMSETLAAGNNWETPGAYQIVTGITPGQTYQFSVEAYTTTGFIWEGALLQLGFEPTGGGAVSTVENPSGVVQYGGGALVSPPVGQWTQFSFTATAPAGDTEAIVYLMCQDYNNITYNQAISSPENINYDNASLIAVPEPAIIALLGMGLAFPLYLIRRRK
ncbi:MAG TPA: PEP-CTERM sorting domain-containing protein [Candidatus Sulfopaludibacter sp.]|nr:PEP-CTERM sorting domain-containing protein [Candidatus Sulfopaludibacter sp.]